MSVLSGLVGSLLLGIRWLRVLVAASQASLSFPVFIFSCGVVGWSFAGSWSCDWVVSGFCSWVWLSGLCACPGLVLSWMISGSEAPSSVVGALISRWLRGFSSDSFE